LGSVEDDEDSDRKAVRSRPRMWDAVKNDSLAFSTHSTTTAHRRTGLESDSS
jgi:hypothetical protein